MKIFFIIILSFLGLNSFGQTPTYQPFPDSNAVWCAWRAFLNYNPPNSTMNSYIYQQTIGSDTLINGTTYKKLEESGLFSWQEWPIPSSAGSYNYYHEYVGCFREQTKIIYFILPFDTIEYILYNFNLTVGDTLPFSVNTGGNIVISSVDSIFDNFIYRKRYHLSDIDTSLWSNPNYYEYVSIIEGIGSTHGLLWMLDPYNPEVGGELEAFKLNEIVLLPDSSTICEVTGIDDSQIEKDTFLLYPNPFSYGNVLEISSKRFYDNYNLYDLYGKLIEQNKIIDNRIHLNQVTLTKGMYFLQLFNTKGAFIIQKIIYLGQRN